MSPIPRSLQRRSFQISFSSTKHFKTALFVTLAATVIFSTFYLSFYEIPSTSSDHTIGEPDTAEEASGSHEIDHSTSNQGHKQLWSYVAENDGSDGWRWVGTQRAEGYRRPSWGGMTQQGPKANVRTNLYSDKHYLTTFPEAGFNNQVIEISNLIAVALRSGRIPILAPFTPDNAHLLHDESFLSVTEVFDLTELVAHHHVPVIELMELKVGKEDWISIAGRHRSVVYDGEHPQFDEVRQVALSPGEIIMAEEPEFDRLQCWNTFLAVQESEGGHIGTLWPTVMEQTPLPASAYANNRPIEQNTIFDISLPRIAEAIAAFTRDSDSLPESSVQRLKILNREPSRMVPDDPFGCLHRMYFPHMNPETEDVRDDWRSGVGAWDEVGRYLKFQPGLVRLAEDLMRTFLGVEASGKVPSYMAVHIRRTDFGDEYRDATQRQWSYSAWQLLHKIKDMQGVDIRHIVFTTDETDEEWLRPLREIGWIHVDHGKARTGDKLGWWFPTILDSVILSSSRVFLGVPTSTMSILPYRRVLDWEGGIARFIQDPRTFEVPTQWEWARDW